MFEKVFEFRCLGEMLSIKKRLGQGNRCEDNKSGKTALSKFLDSKVFSRARLYTALITPTLTYGCEAWATTGTTERILRTFENKVWRAMCGPVYDNGKETWRREYYKELQEEMGMVSVIGFTRGQRIQ